MLNSRNIGFIGAGNVARALIGGILKGQHGKKEQLSTSDCRQQHLDVFKEKFDIATTPDNKEVVTRSEIILLCVKPQVLDKVLDEITPALGGAEKLIISVAAGVPIAAIQDKLPPLSRIVRVMPNIAALVGEGASALSSGEHASNEDLETARKIFDAVGKTVVVEESLLDAVTGLSGSGPSYIFLIIDALADAGVKVGLSREDALMLAAQTVAGSAKLLIESGEHPGRLKDMVTSPGGTAISGIHTLEEGGLRTTLINAVEMATARSKELGSQFKKS